MKKSLIKRITALITAICIFMLCVLPASVSADDTKTQFTDAEMLEMGFNFNVFSSYSGIFSNFKTYFYNLSLNPSVDFSKLFVFSLNVRFTTSYGGTRPVYFLVDPDCIFNVGEDDNYFYFSNFKNTTFYSCIIENSLDSSSDYSSCFVPSIISQNSRPFSFAIPKNDNLKVKFSTFRYIDYINGGFSSVIDIFNDSSRFNSSRLDYCGGVYWTDFSSSPFYFYRCNYSSNLDKPDINNTNTSHTLYGAPVFGPEGRPDAVKFSQWIVDYDHVKDIVNAGFNVGQNKVKQLTDWWLKYSCNLGTVVLGLPELVSISNNADLTISLAKSLISCYNDLYAQYRYWLTHGDATLITPSGSAAPHWRDKKDDNGNIIDGDNTLMTDLEDDDTLISILREILRTAASIPSYTYQIFDGWTYYFRSYLSDFNVLFDFLSSLPSVISGAVTDSINEPVEMIIEAINSSSGGGSGDIQIDVTISEDKQTEISNFFIEWNAQYTEKINEKIPVVSQLSSLFDDTFFEKIGIDMNNDGQTYSYYRSDEMLYDMVQPYVLDSGGGSASSEEQRAILDMLSHFDYADPEFLDDVHFSEDVPDWHVTIDGEKRSIFSFKLFAKYRTQIHSIIIFCIYTLYFLSLFKSIPSIIGSVSDVHNAFEKHSNIDKGDDFK